MVNANILTAIKSTVPVPKPRPLLKNGAIKIGALSKGFKNETLRDRREDSFYLPEFCAPMAVLGVVLLAILVAFALTLARQSSWAYFFPDLGKTSMLMIWMGLSVAAILCATRSRLARYPVVTATIVAYFLAIAMIGLVSEAVYWLGYWMDPANISGDDSWFPANHWFFLSRNLAVGVLITGLVLRYFYVSHQWQDNVERQAESRIHALQARIRPHFLFNSMNTIAALTRSNPEAAEAAVEDLADLFRASLSDSKEMIRLGEELEIAEVYQRMEQQRLGERLIVNWDTANLPRAARIPSLTLQPILENAIYHGVEPLPEPGHVDIKGHRKGEMIYISVRNPIPIEKYQSSPGNRIALDNIRERLRLAFGPRAGLSLAVDATHYEVTIAFPFQE
jgi:two-component system sensor histidine kinase AlgZ